jgi:hypothetical protein
MCITLCIRGYETPQAQAIHRLLRHLIHATTLHEINVPELKLVDVKAHRRKSIVAASGPRDTRCKAHLFHIGAENSWAHLL